MPETSGWLIEAADSSLAEPMYFCIVNGVQQWTPDHATAIRFARKEDAEGFASTFPAPAEVRVYAHVWADPDG